LARELRPGQGDRTSPSPGGVQAGKSAAASDRSAVNTAEYWMNMMARNVFTEVRGKLQKGPKSINRKEDPRRVSEESSLIWGVFKN
jgi:hypothetical protein